MGKISIDLTHLPDITNDIYIPLYTNKNRYLVLMGGGGSGKSHFTAQKIIYRILTEKKHRILVCRKVANTLRNSVFDLLRGTIADWGMSELFKINKSDMKITCINGNEVLFAGLDDVEKLKSIYNITSIWIEEASEIDPTDFRQLDIRLRGETLNYKQIILSFNPVSVTHWLKSEFFDTKKEDSFTLHTTYKHNKFLDKEAIKVLEGFKDIDPYYYAVYCLGEWGVIGRTVFDAQKVTERIYALRGIKSRVGRLENKEGKIVFIEDINGYITIYEQPKPNHPYVIGADVAEGLPTGDYDAAQVLDNITLNQVAVFHGHMDVDQYAEELNKLGLYYNSALLTVETNFNPGTVLNLEKLNYPKQYIKQRIDSINKEIQGKFGWRTDKINRAVILSNLIELVRDHINLINDIPTLEEMLTFVRNEKGRMEAQDGKHDDLILSLAIALESAMSGQQTKASAEREIDVSKLPEDLQEDYYNAAPEQQKYLAEKWGLTR